MEIVKFPNPGVELLDEAERFSVWQEVFAPGVAAPAHRHMHDYIAFFPDGGELTLTHVSGELEDYAILSGGLTPIPSLTGGTRFDIAAGTTIRSRVPPAGTAHVALNEGNAPLRMVLIEIK